MLSVGRVRDVFRQTTLVDFYRFIKTSIINALAHVRRTPICPKVVGGNVKMARIFRKMSKHRVSRVYFYIVKHVCDNDFRYTVDFRLLLCDISVCRRRRGKIGGKTQSNNNVHKKVHFGKISAKRGYPCCLHSILIALDNSLRC